MEREILFRAKAINRDIGIHRTNYKNGDWIYGLVTRLYDNRFGNLPAEMRDLSGVIGIEIDHNTIGQDIGFYVEWVSDRDRNIHRKDLGYWLSAGTAEIVGNIHDNPELLKKE